MPRLVDSAIGIASSNDPERMGRPLQWGRPHMSLGPGIPDPPSKTLAPQQPRHRLNADRGQVPVILGGLHHEYALIAETGAWD